MRMLSAPVLAAAALVTSPALYQGLVLETMAIEPALPRFAVALLLFWVAVSAVEMLVGEAPRPAPVTAADDPSATAPPTPAESH